MMDVQPQVQRVPCPPEWEGTWRVTAMRLWEMLEKSSSSDEHVQDCRVDSSDSSDDLLNLRAGEQNFETMQRFGFWGEKARQVAGMPHVTERLIAYWVAHSSSLALALFRIRENWRVPRDWVPAEPGAEVCPVCGKTGEHAPGCARRYVSGEFAEFVES